VNAILTQYNHCVHRGRRRMFWLCIIGTLRNIHWNNLQMSYTNINTQKCCYTSKWCARCEGGLCSSGKLRNVDRRLVIDPLKMGITGSSETSVTNCQSTLSNRPEQHRPHLHHDRILKSLRYHHQTQRIWLDLELLVSQVCLCSVAYLGILFGGV
jgi:hypothetical protein